MKYIRLILPLLIVLSFAALPNQAQGQIFEITYGETQSAVFEGDELNHNWIFIGEPRDLLKIHVFRIGGQFTPHLRLLDASANVLAESQGDTFSDYDELSYPEGLSDDSPVYQIEVSRSDKLSNNPANPPEYSLTLEHIGKRRATPDEGLASVLPDIGLETTPELQIGTSQRLPLQIDAYGENITVSGPVDSRYLVASQAGELTVNQSLPIANGVLSATFLDEGIGLTIRNEILLNDGDRIFFSDENFTVAYNNDNRQYTFTLRSGTADEIRIVTDFRHIESVQVRDGAVAFRMTVGDTVKRLVFNNRFIDIRQLTSGATEAVLTQIQLDDRQFITTDLLGWDTLAYYNKQLRVYYGNDARFLSDSAYYLIQQNATNPQQHNIAWFESNSPTARRINMTVNWQSMGDLWVTEGQVFVEPLAGQRIAESLDSLKALLLEDSAVQFTRINNTERTIFPDGTEIESPAELDEDFNLLPYEEGFRTRNYNNLGENILPLCACVEVIEPMTPVNPANGNFFYKVNDFFFPGHQLQLDLTRYYNSHAVVLTPQYMLDSPVAYPIMGEGWRHSYQYELDISTAPLGRIRFIEPDGTNHYFRPDSANANLWTSPTRLSMTITREGGALGTWLAERTDGLKYYFDRAGRLSRINISPTQSITISPAPFSSEVGDRGILIVEPYGRRIELYEGESGYIEIARDTLARQIRYTYDDTQLTSVEYNTNTQTAIYTYNSSGLLERYDDVRSPYVRVGAIQYDALRRVERYTENPDGNLVPSYVYSYSDTDGGHTASRSIQVGREERTTIWQFNNTFQLTNLLLPRERWNYEFTYDATAGTLSSIRIPTLVRFNFTFDRWGNLTRFEDPFFTGEQSYRFSYEPFSNRITQIRYPNNRVDTFQWSNGDNPQLLMHEVLVFTGIENTIRRTSFEYDDWGRVSLMVEPGNIGTVYQYDRFGYVSAIWQGIELEPNEALVDISGRERALRVLQLDYDLLGQLGSFTDGRGNRYTLSWFNTEQLKEVRDPAGSSIRYSYDDRGRIISVDNRAQLTRYNYNGLDQLVDIIDANDGQTTFSYDEAGNLLTVVDGLGRPTSFSYDAINNPTRRVLPNGATSIYDTSLNLEAGFVLRREIDPIGRLIERRYDAIGRLIRYRISDDGFSQEFLIGYNLANNPERIEETTPEHEYVMTYEYNFVGDVRALVVEGSRTEFAYDSQGYLEKRTSPAGKITQYDYDALGNLIGVTLPDESSWQYIYDGNNNLLKATDPNGLTTEYVYDDLNQLISIQDPAGNIQGFGYDIRGNLTSIVDPREIIRSFEYDLLANLTSARVGQEQVTRYVYDKIGHLSSIEQRPVRSTRFTYDVADNIIGITQIGDNRTLFSYDPIGRITSITDPLGRTTAYQYNAIGRITQIIDPIGNVQSFDWQPGTMDLAQYTSPSGQVFAINTQTDPLGRATLIRDMSTVSDPLNTYISYDADGYLTGLRVATENARNDTDPTNDAFYRYEYDAKGNPIRYIDPLGGDWRYIYDAGSRLIAMINPDGIATRYQYDAAGNITQITYYSDTPEQAVEQFEYDANGNIRAYISANGTRNEYTYDQNNNIAQAVLAVGTDVEHIYKFAYNGLGDLTSVEDPLGRITGYFYLLDNPSSAYLSFEGEDLLDLRYDFDGAGNLSNIQLRRTAPNENELLQTNLTYDALNRRVRYVNSEDKSWSYTYDAVGNITQVSDPLGSVVSYTYDNYNRVTNIQYPSGSTVRMSYDSAGNLASITLPPNAQGTSQRILYDLDPLGNITAIQIGNNISRYDYDDMGNVIARIAPNRLRTDYEYDAAGRLIATRYNDGSAIEYSYDNEGNLLSAGDSHFEYDELGRTRTATENDLHISYFYDAVGNIKERDAGAFGLTRYDYDPLNRLTQIELNGDQIALEYNELNQIVTIQRSNGVRSTINYDSVGRPLNITHSSSTNPRLDGFEYQYDAVGNLIRIRRSDFWSILYSYDVDHRLISERWLNDIDETVYVVSLRYDEAGNRIEELRNGRRTNFSYDAENHLIREVRNVAAQESRFLWLPTLGLGMAMIFVMRRRWWLLPGMLLLVGVVFAQTSTPQVTIDYNYDANGNLVEINYGRSSESSKLQLSYDAENRLIAANGQDQNGDAVDTELAYDQFSRLVKWRSAETQYTIFYDGHTPLAMTDGNTVQQFLYVDNQRLLTQNSDLASLWHLNDPMGSTRRYTDAEGALITDSSYFREFGSFGVRIFPYDKDGIAPEGSAVTAPTPFFGGQIYDPSTGLYLMGLRAYDPMTGRFLQADPIRHDPIGTLYTYARNRPLVFSDPTGMTVKPFVDSLDAAILEDKIRPESIIPRPTLPTMPSLPAVHHLQEDETFRAFRLLEQLRYGTNSVIGQLSPLRNDFFLFDFNPIPDPIRQLSAKPLHQVMNIYETGDSWLPDPRPNPTRAGNPFNQIREIEPLLAQAYIQPLNWKYGNDVSTTILPSVAVPQGLSEQWQVESDLLTTLQPVSLMTSLVPETNYLVDLNNFASVPQIPQPTVSLPTAPVEPPVLHNLDTLRQQTFEFNSRIWSLNGTACGNCLSPLSFGR
jgi:RHS repeat-associated protein